MTRLGCANAAFSASSVDLAHLGTDVLSAAVKTPICSSVLEMCLLSLREPIFITGCLKLRIASSCSLGKEAGGDCEVVVTAGSGMSSPGSWVEPTSVFVDVGAVGVEVGVGTRGVLQILHFGQSALRCGVKQSGFAQTQATEA